MVKVVGGSVRVKGLFIFSGFRVWKVLGGHYILSMQKRESACKCMQDKIGFLSLAFLFSLVGLLND